jgi:hypothetical protein
MALALERTLRLSAPAIDSLIQRYADALRRGERPEDVLAAFYAHLWAHLVEAEAKRSTP